jgi:hypothetical protein
LGGCVRRAPRTESEDLIAAALIFQVADASLEKVVERYDA